MDLTEEARQAIEQEMAAQASLIMNNPAFQKAVEDIKRVILAAWAGTKPTATAEREEYQRRYVALTTIEGILRDYLVTGTMHAARIEQEQRETGIKNRLKRFWRVEEPIHSEDQVT